MAARELYRNRRLVLSWPKMILNKYAGSYFGTVLGLYPAGSYHLCILVCVWLVQLTQGARVKPIPPVLVRRLRPADRSTFYGASGVFATADHRRYARPDGRVFLCDLPYLVRRQQRACEQDRTMALLGINDCTISLTMLGAMLAAVAGVLVTVYYGVVDFYIGFVAGIKAFTVPCSAASALPGAMLGGLLIGLDRGLLGRLSVAGIQGRGDLQHLILVLMFGLLRPAWPP